MKINAKWEITADQHCWTLTQREEKVREKDSGKHKAGSVYESEKISYHGTLKQACMKIIDQDAKTGESVIDIINAIGAAEANITAAIERAALTRDELRG